MKTVIETPEQKLKAKIARYKKEYAVNVKNAKERYRFDVADYPTKGRIIDKLVKSKETYKQGELCWQSVSFEDRKAIAKELMGNALNIKVHVGEGSYLNLANLKISECHYTITFLIRNGGSYGLRLRHPIDYAQKPTDAEVLKIAQNYFPNVKLIQQ